MVVVVVGEVVVVDGHDHTQNEQEKENEKTKVDVGNHLIPTGHLILNGGREGREREREREVKSTHMQHN